MSLTPETIPLQSFDMTAHNMKISLLPSWVSQARNNAFTF
jgi:hypothetical protein